jgi:hypothetical protein
VPRCSVDWARHVLELQAHNPTSEPSCQARRADLPVRDSRSAPSRPPQLQGRSNRGLRAQFRLQISALLTRFLRDHDVCIAAAGGGEWDVITTIPSSSGRTGPHPLEEVIHLSRRLSDSYRPLLETGSAKLRFRQADDQGFVTRETVDGLRVLLMDDTLTTGARTQSAASTLSLSGAEVVAVVPVGRVIAPDYNDESGALWSSARSTPFDFDTCCLE